MNEARVVINAAEIAKAEDKLITEMKFIPERTVAKAEKEHMKVTTVEVHEKKEFNEVIRSLKPPEPKKPKIVQTSRVPTFNSLLLNRIGEARVVINAREIIKAEEELRRVIIEKKLIQERIAAEAEKELIKGKEELEEIGRRLKPPEPERPEIGQPPQVRAHNNLIFNKICGARVVIKSREKAKAEEELAKVIAGKKLVHEKEIVEVEKEDMKLIAEKINTKRKHLSEEEVNIYVF
ncbi:hypothetical protein NPIL_614631 [Nephila pilipes]|uniref:Uncharacterized protein n=1 Tax=Nephila pilipes TaxID=299642 RepID=A0A8X6T7P7_NEPPI|nr:hypothetical protein NPIL_614631 [Nephila pilipes]